jgi:hypothetical protein
VGQLDDRPRARLRRQGLCAVRAGTISAKSRAEMDTLADLMAEGCPSIAEAARRLGTSQTRTDQHWQRIRRDLGEQAA